VSCDNARMKSRAWSAAALLLPMSCAPPIVPTREEVARGCYGDESCIQACTAGPEDTREADCELHRRDARDQKMGWGAYAKAARGAKDRAEGTVVARSETPLSAVVLAARSRPAVVSIRSAGGRARVLASTGSVG
jgi:hypothetical protein